MIMEIDEVIAHLFELLQMVAGLEQRLILEFNEERMIQLSFDEGNHQKRKTR